jgi:polysaccharide biosynthesis PFTS motif protein
MRAPYPMLHTPKAALQFLVWSLGSTFAAVCALFAGNWWRAMMLSESAKAWLVQLQQPEVLARDYLFHNSNWIYRPLWTYPAEKKGSRILFYFYSTNVEQFKQLGVYPEPLYGWKCTSWPNYLVWDEAQKNFLLRANVAEAAVEVVGPITFHAGSLLPTDLPEHSIAVFDVQPMRDAVYQPLAIDLEYYVPLVASGFLADIAHCTKNSRYHIVLKRKRDVGSRVHPRYRKTLEDLAAGQRFVEIDPNVSAQALIEKSAAVISAPFTSTALLARELGKPSAYYDPSGLCEPDDRAAHGVPVLAGRAELARWLASLA